MAEATNKNLQSYMAANGHLFDFEKTKRSLALKQMLTVFNEYDFKSDEERSDILMVYSNEDEIAEDNDFLVLSKNFKGKRTPELFLKALMKCELAIYTEDAYSVKDGLIPNFSG
jgi:hypothetical protein